MERAPLACPIVADFLFANLIQTRNKSPFTPVVIPDLSRNPPLPPLGSGLRGNHGYGPNLHAITLDLGRARPTRPPSLPILPPFSHRKWGRFTHFSYHCAVIMSRRINIIRRKSGPTESTTDTPGHKLPGRCSAMVAMEQDATGQGCGSRYRGSIARLSAIVSFNIRMGWVEGLKPSGDARQGDVELPVRKPQPQSSRDPSYSMRRTPWLPR